MDSMEKKDRTEYFRQYQRESEKHKAYQKEYHARDEVKEKKKDYMKQYNSNPEVIAKRKEWYQAHKEEIKAKRLAKKNPE